MKRLSVVLTLAASMWACSGSPTAPTVAPTPTRPTATLSGLVFAMTLAGLQPVEGARVRLEIGSFRLDATTDRSGLYTLSGLYDGNSSVSTSKDGYEPDTRQVSIRGAMRLDIGILPRLPHTLSGVVSEVTPAGLVPVEGVEVYCDACGEFGHTFAHTDTLGSYSFSLVYNGVTPLLIRKEGYAVVDPSGTFPDGAGRRNATVNGDTRFDIQLVRR